MEINDRWKIIKLPFPLFLAMCVVSDDECESSLLLGIVWNNALVAVEKN